MGTGTGAAGRRTPGIPFLKGHGTENDFVIIPDPDGALELDAALVARICDRRAGIGADGVLRVVRSAAHPEAAELADSAEWFMDYRNSDGSIAEMCGNGVRVFARYLVDAGLAGSGDLAVATRAGLRRLHIAKDAPDGTPGEVTVDMGKPAFPQPQEGVLATPRGGAEPVAWPAVNVNMGNPHAVVFVQDLAEAGHLYEAPEVTPAGAYPEGVNVEFVADLGPRAVAMRVHERGSGETRSCGTGACAVMVAAARRDGRDPLVTGERVTYTVDLPGGRLVISQLPDGTVEMTGPAVIVGEGVLYPGQLLGR
ncbi:diaminopimelate epimerase [Phaeacidiphilus oryzae]|uniref:diaminopimelate epimerase n=1 Tax=Phaeacidiphilus oryzae TaxID=348818 RepID=UPI00068A7437|nr:diaminopimelate epimerase [Phaeacidiphilus oryzae]